MKPCDQLVPHPAATLFPMMDGDALKALADDIKANGQREPVVVYDGKILDGRNRVQACVLAGVQPQFVTLAECESPTTYVISKNLHRRHLSAVQRATLLQSSEVLDSYRAEAKERQRVHGNTAPGRRNTPSGSSKECSSPASNNRVSAAVAEAAAAFGVGRDSAYTMGKIKETASDVFDRAKAGEFKTVAEAARAAGLPVSGSKVRGVQLVPQSVGECGDEPEATSTAQPATRPTSRAKHDEKIRELLLDGHPAADIARQLGISENIVSYAKKRLGMTGNPLRGPLDFAVEATESFQTMSSAWKPQWSTASREQNQELVSQLDQLVRAVRGFVQRLNKEAKE